MDAMALTEKQTVERFNARQERIATNFAMGIRTKVTKALQNSGQVGHAKASHCASRLRTNETSRRAAGPEASARTLSHRARRMRRGGSAS